MFRKLLKSTSICSAIQVFVRSKYTTYSEENINEKSTSTNSQPNLPTAPFNPVVLPLPSFTEMIENLESQAHVYINEQIVSTAVDQIKESKPILQEKAKSIILEYLMDPRYPSKLGVLVQSILLYEYVRHPTRELIYWSLALPTTINNTNSLALYHLKYWVTEDGHPYTDKLLIDFLDWWICHPLTVPTLISPLIEWSLEQNDISLDPVRQSILDTLKSPQVKEQAKMGLIYALSESLKSDEVKEGVKLALLSFLKKATTEDDDDDDDDDDDEAEMIVTNNEDNN